MQMAESQGKVEIRLRASVFKGLRDFSLLRVQNEVLSASEKAIILRLQYDAPIGNHGNKY